MFKKITIIKSSPSLFVVPLFETKIIRNFGAAVFGVGDATYLGATVFDPFGGVISWSLSVVG
jgi:hypothetical protein